MINPREALFRTSFELSKLSPLGWGGFQYYVELTGSKPGPINFAEEFIEGSVPAGIMAFAFLKIAQRLDKGLSEEERIIAEGYAYQVGALTGYMGMMIGGMVLHRILDVEDVKWGL